MNYSSVPDQTEVGIECRPEVKEVTDNPEVSQVIDGIKLYRIDRDPNYLISKCGRVRSKAREVRSGRGGGTRMTTPQWLKGRIHKNGYEMVMLTGQKKVCVHSLVAETFLGHVTNYVTVVDHIDQDKANNRVENLRIVSRKVNALNSSNSRSVSGFKGVSRRNDKWGARIMINGKEVHLGVFDTPEEAHAVYKAAVAKHLPE